MCLFVCLLFLQFKTGSGELKTTEMKIGEIKKCNES